MIKKTITKRKIGDVERFVVSIDNRKFDCTISGMMHLDYRWFDTYEEAEEFCKKCLIDIDRKEIHGYENN